MADVALTFLLQEVKEILVGYRDLIAGAKNEFRQLEDELSTFKAFLEEAANKSKRDKMYREMERQVRELVYDVEDTIDSCLTDAAAAKAKNVFGRCLDPSCINLAQQVKTLRQERVRPMTEKVMKMKFSQIDAAHGSETGKSMEGPRPQVKKDLSMRLDKLVNFEGEDLKIINYLMESKEELDVISIIGMPGLGKTTLAWMIFQNKAIVDKFSTRIWVHVSQRFNSRDVFLNILKYFTSQGTFSLSYQELNDEELIQAVHACLNNGRFLLVLDDVWTVENWQEIRNVLPISNEKGKVLITSREKKVGISATTNRQPHTLRFLTPEESWKLLQLEVFGNLKSCPTELVSIGKLIADQCGQVPLTLMVIGGILVEQYMKTQSIIALEEEWLKVSENVRSILQTDEKRISDAVTLSYDALSEDLRECFLYMGVFPENQEIPAWTLTRLWIAEGFVRPKKGKNLEETAEEYLYELVNRNLLMVGKKNLDQVKTCHVHDMIRAFCRSKALEQNLFQVMKKSEDGLLEPPISEVQKLHRLCLHSGHSTFFSGITNGPSIRSFLCFYKEPVKLDPKYTAAIPDAFDLLRVMDTKSIRFHEFPRRVADLIHLRYVTLSVENLQTIPGQIHQLWNLQTLIVETNSSSITMEANIWRMIRLRHLKTNAAIALDKNWKGQAGENLQTLSRLSPESCTEAVYKRARNLKSVGIRGNLANLFDMKFLEKLHRAENLKIMHDLASEDPLDGLPQPNVFPPNLKRLTLSRTNLADWRHMSVLAKMDTLEVLKLKDNAFTGATWKAEGDGFPRLQFLLIENTGLVIWKASTNHFPRLRCLVLKNCKKLQQIPMALKKNLEKLDIEHLSSTAVDSAKMIEKEKEQEQEGKLGVPFRLRIGPGCE